MQGKSKKPVEDENPTSPVESIIDVDDSSVDFSDNISESSSMNPLPAKETLVDNTPKQPKKVGFVLWFEEHKSTLESENPDASTAELTKLGTQMFKALSPDEKQVQIRT